jgi:hypothetical protein
MMPFRLALLLAVLIFLGVGGGQRERGYGISVGHILFFRVLSQVADKYYFID